MSNRIDDLIDDFALLDDWEERYKYVIELGRGLPPMNDVFKTAATKVNGCASQVWIRSQPMVTPHGRRLALEGDSDALIVKGLIAVAFLMFESLPLEAIPTYDANVTFAKLGLAEHLTPQRSNGFASMISRIKADAQREISEITSS